MTDPAATGNLGVWTGPFLAAALALIPSGFAKLRAPEPAARALGAVGLPVPQWSVRAFAALECTAGSAAVVFGGRVTAALVAALYGAFAVFLTALLRAPERVESCGCAGDRRIAPSGLHLTLVVGAAVAAGGAAVEHLGGAPEILRAAPLAATGTLVGAAVLVFTSFLVATELPGALSAYRAGAAPGPAPAPTSRGPTRRFSMDRPR